MTPVLGLSTTQTTVGDPSDGLAPAYGDRKRAYLALGASAPGHLRLFAQGGELLVGHAGFR
jgi:hypothetical protein